MVKDWKEVHLPLVEAHPEVLGGVKFEVRNKQPASAAVHFEP